MKKSVGLILMSWVPQEDGSKKLVAILQRRGIWDFERMDKETFPGCYQVTFHGGLEENETFLSHQIIRIVNLDLIGTVLNYVNKQQKLSQDRPQSPCKHRKFIKSKK